MGLSVTEVRCFVFASDGCMQLISSFTRLEVGILCRTIGFRFISCLGGGFGTSNNVGSAFGMRRGRAPGAI